MLYVDNENQWHRTTAREPDIDPENDRAAPINVAIDDVKGLAHIQGQKSMRRANSSHLLT